MRIGYLTYGLDRSPAGIARYAVELLRALDRCDHQHELVLLTTEQQDPHGLWQQFEHHPLVGCQRLPVLMTVGNLLLSRATRQHHLDLVHDPNGIAPFLGPDTGTRRVVTIHDAFAYVVADAHNWLDNWRYHWQLPMAARRAEAVITVSDCSWRDIVHYLRLFPSQTYVVPQGIDPRFEPLPDNQERRAVLERYGVRQPYIFYVGGINARKNIARLFEAFACIAADYPDLTLVMGGKRQWRTGEIDATLQRLDLGERIHFTGYVDDADLPALYSAAELFAFPSLYEGFGFPPLEAMACGTPVVTSNVSSLPDVAGDAALLVDPYTIEDIAGAMRRLLDDPDLVADLRRKGYTRASTFTWERTASETLHLYETVMGGA